MTRSEAELASQFVMAARRSRSRVEITRLAALLAVRDVRGAFALLPASRVADDLAPLTTTVGRIVERGVTVGHGRL